MIQLLWGLVNIGLFLFFIIICFKATKLIRERIGFLSAIIFVFGLLSFVGQSGNDNTNNEPDSNQIKTWKFSSADSLKRNESYSLNIDLEKTVVSTYGLGIIYGKDKQGQRNIPISAYSSTTGFIMGTHWKPVSIIVERTNDPDKFKYSVDGVVDWRLLGTTIYSQLKEYKGVAWIK